MSKEKEFVISGTNLPSMLPLFPSITSWIALDHWSAPGWLYGVIGSIFVFWWIAAILKLSSTTAIDIFSIPEGEEKSKFDQWKDSLETKRERNANNN